MEKSTEADAAMSGNQADGKETVRFSSAPNMGHEKASMLREEVMLLPRQVR